MKVQIGGEERLLRFGTMETLELAGEIFTGDPLELMYGINTMDLLTLTAAKAGNSKEDVTIKNLPVGVGNPKKLFEIISAFTYAGLKSGGTQCTTEQAIEWVRGMGYEDGSLILITARNSFADKKQETGEAVAQTQGKKVVRRGKSISPGKSSK